MVALGVVVFLCLGTVYSWSVFRRPVEQMLDVSAVQSGLPYLFALVFYSAMMPLTGWLLERRAPAPLIAAGGLLVGLGWFLSSFAGGIAAMALTLGVVAGSGVGVAYGAVIAAVSRSFPDRRGLATGLTLSGFGLSPFVTAPLSRRLMEDHGVPMAMRILGIVFFAVIVLSAAAFRAPRQPPVQRGGDGADRPGNEPARLKTSRPFFLLWACFALGTFNGLMAVSITGPVGEELFALSPGGAALAVSLCAVFNCLGRPLFGWVTDAFGPRWSAASIFAAIVAASGIMLFPRPTAVLYYLSFALLWLALGGWMATAPAATARLFGSGRYARNYGVVFTAYGVGAVLGVLVSGSLRDALGSYRFVFLPMLLTGAAGLALSWFLKGKGGTGAPGSVSREQ